MDSLGLAIDTSAAIKCYELKQVMRNTFIFNCKNKDSNTGEWYYLSNYEEIRTEYKDSIFYRRIITDACCNKRNYHDENEQIIKYKKNGNHYYISIFEANGKKLEEGNSLYPYPIVWCDTLKKFYLNGNLKMLELYQNGKLINKLYYSENGKQFNDVQVIADIYPKQIDSENDFDKDLLKFFLNNYKYPSKASENFIMPTVYTSFIITTDGEIECIEILRGHPLLNSDIEEALGKIPKFSPAIKKDKVINLKYNFPIKHHIR